MFKIKLNFQWVVIIISIIVIVSFGAFWYYRRQRCTNITDLEECVKKIGCKPSLTSTTTRLITNDGNIRCIQD